MLKRAVATLFVSAAYAFADPISFSKIPAGDSLQITLVGSGCFHYHKYELVFVRGEKVTAKVTKIAPVDDAKKPATKREERAPAQTMTLSAEDCAGLDRVFAFYREKQPGGCTSVNWISLTQKRGNATVASEELMDATCKAREVKGGFLLDTIITRASGKQPWEG